MAASCSFVSPHLSHREWGFQEIGTGKGRDTLMQTPRQRVTASFLGL